MKTLVQQKLRGALAFLATVLVLCVGAASGASTWAASPSLDPEQQPPMIAAAGSSGVWQGDYAQVFPEFTAEAFNLDAEGRLTVGSSKVEVTGTYRMPDTAGPGSSFVLHLNADDWRFVDFNGLQLKNAEGTVLATASATASALTIFPSEESQHLQAVQGTFSFFITPRITGVERTVQLDLLSPADAKLGPGSQFKFYRQLPNYTGGLVVPSVLRETELLLLAQPQYVNPSQPFNPASVTFTIKPLTKGATPVCDSSQREGRMWWVDEDRVMGKMAGAPIITCSGNVMTLKIPAGIEMPTGTSGVRMEGPFVVDRPLYEYAFEYTMNVGGTTTVVERAAKSGILAGTAAGELRPAKTVLSKVVELPSDGKIRVGDSISYRVRTVSEESFRTAYGVVTTDVLPAGVKFISASGSGKYAEGTRTITWPGQDLAAGESVSHTVTVEVLKDSADSLTNQAKNTGINTCFLGDDTGSICAASAAVEVSRPGMTMKKSAQKVEDSNKNGFTGDPGDTVFYRFELTNTGNQPESSALLSDPLLGVENHQCLKQPLAPGASTFCAGTFTHVITAAEASVGNVKNTAHLTVPGLPKLTDSTTTPAFHPKLRLEKSVRDTVDTNENGFLGDEGDTVIFDFEVTNVGNSTLTTAVLTDPLLNIRDQECLRGELLPGKSVLCQGSFTHVITAEEADEGVVTNIAVITSPGANPAEGSASTPAYRPAVQLSKRIVEVEDTNQNRIIGDVGDTISYGFTVENTGNSVLETVLIDDPLLGVSGAECLSAPLPPSDPSQSGGEVNVAECVELPEFRHVISWADDAAGVVVNTATATSPGADPSDSTATWEVEPTPTGEQQLAKTGWRGGVGAALLAGVGLAALGASLLYRTKREQL